MRTTGGDMETMKRSIKEHYARLINDIETRLSRYYETDEIDVDLANAIHTDAEVMVGIIKRLLKQNEELDEGLTRAIQEIDRLKYGRNEQ